MVPLNNYIWYKQESIVFNSEGNMGSTAVNLLGRNDNAVTINSITLDELLKHSNGKAEAIKMDIEGAELDLIVKSEGFFERHRPKLVIEPHYINGTINTQDIIDALKNMVIKQNYFNNMIYTCH